MDLVKAALRRVARERPDVPEALVRELVLGGIDPAAVLVPESSYDESALPDRGAVPDFLARIGSDELLHVEFQGYPDSGFVDRLFRQHDELCDLVASAMGPSASIDCLRDAAIALASTRGRYHAIARVFLSAER